MFSFSWNDLFLKSQTFFFLSHQIYRSSCLICYLKPVRMIDRLPLAELIAVWQPRGLKKCRRWHSLWKQSWWSTDGRRRAAESELMDVITGPAGYFSLFVCFALLSVIEMKLHSSTRWQCLFGFRTLNVLKSIVFKISDC